MKTFHCDHCGQLVFFENVRCVNCSHLLAYVPEADDAEREKRRLQMHEPYRTLLGHFRHETGHYSWDRLIQGSDNLEGFRRLFGDERQDYAAALQTHYRQGPRPDWQQRFVS